MEIQQIMKGIAAVWNEMCHSNLSHW
jgi:hypothetical protein